MSSSLTCCESSLGLRAPCRIGVVYEGFEIGIDVVSGELVDSQGERESDFGRKHA